jgi:hypothetical protein
MTSQHRVLAAAALVGLAVAGAEAQPRATPAAPVLHAARGGPGSIQGIVTEDRGRPLEGVMVSAMGGTLAFAVTDEKGHFALGALPPGGYLLRASLAGFAASPREYIEVAPSAREVRRIQLRRLGDPTAGVRPILVAGGAAAGEAVAAAEPTADSDAGTHPHNETAWRLRHLRRNILKNRGAAAAADDEAPDAPGGVSFLDGPLSAPAGLALFAGVPFTGELNLLTTGAFDRPADLFSIDGLPRGVAYLAIGAPVGTHGNWRARAALTQAERSSWVVSADYAAKGERRHAYTVGMSYGAQEYVRASRLALAPAADTSRHVGVVYAYDVWTVGPRLVLDYGGRYERYDYLEREALFSPRVSLRLTPLERTHVTATVGQRMLAPGAEEFLPPPARGLWLPPERTFAPLASEQFRVERVRRLDVGVEREIGDAFVIGVRRFYQHVDDQLVTLFGLDAGIADADLGHYLVTGAGRVEADGWVVGVSTPISKRARGSVDYRRTQAVWHHSPEMAAIGRLAPSAWRPDTEEIHDVTTSLETEIPETATRVFVLYKINTAYAANEAALARPGLDARFDVQVNQALPFLPFGSQWELLIGVRNLFRQVQDGASVYDELLVIRPPKRIVGGVQVRF